jgi:hypothetical protein
MEFRIRQNAVRIYFKVCYDHDTALCKHHRHQFILYAWNPMKGRVRSISMHCVQGIRSVDGPTASCAWYAIYTRYQSSHTLMLLRMF